MINKDWQIIYSNYTGTERRALDFLYGELSSTLLRTPGIYSIPTLNCQPAGTEMPQENAIIIGTRQKNLLLQQLAEAADVPKDGFIVRFQDNPAAAGKKLILIAGDTPESVLYGCIDFIDDILQSTLPEHGNDIFLDTETLNGTLPNLEVKRAPETSIRSIFTWGHTFNDYRTYIQNMARLKFNELILWNEYPPINAEEVLEYAHSWGIKLLWGFSWGWNTGCGAVAEKMLNASAEELKALEDSIVASWQNTWQHLGGDGIYFQTFTECREANNAGKTVADVAISVVNHVAERILSQQPTLRIIFGLHATSVKSQMNTIAKSDPRLTILWEDCGTFPFNPDLKIDEEGTYHTVNSILEQKREIGFVYKCQMMLDWTQFAHQSGPYIIGCMNQETIKNDTALILPLWRNMKVSWTKYGKLAYDLAKYLHGKRSLCNMLNVAGNFTLPIQWPTALLAELFWSTQEPYEELLARVMRRKYLNC